MESPEVPSGPPSEWTDEELMRELARRRPEYAQALEELAGKEDDPNATGGQG
ncbi:MAG: hypothetical protein ACRDLA_11635 [Thermoleophilaceae bacterium]